MLPSSPRLLPPPMLGQVPLAGSSQLKQIAHHSCSGKAAPPVTNSQHADAAHILGVCLQPAMPPKGRTPLHTTIPACRPCALTAVGRLAAWPGLQPVHVRREGHPGLPVRDHRGAGEPRRDPPLPHGGRGHRRRLHRHHRLLRQRRPVRHRALHAPQRRQRHHARGPDPAPGGCGRPPCCAALRAIACVQGDRRAFWAVECGWSAGICPAMRLTLSGCGGSLCPAMRFLPSGLADLLVRCRMCACTRQTGWSSSTRRPTATSSCESRHGVADLTCIC